MILVLFVFYYFETEDFITDDTDWYPSTLIKFHLKLLMLALSMLGTSYQIRNTTCKQALMVSFILTKILEFNRGFKYNKIHRTFLQKRRTRYSAPLLCKDNASVALLFAK